MRTFVVVLFAVYILAIPADGLSQGTFGGGLFGGVQPNAVSVKFNGRLGDYNSWGEFTILKDCTFKGVVEFDGKPTGGNLNKIEGYISMETIIFARALRGVHNGQVDHFNGAIVDNGNRMTGSWGGSGFEARLAPPVPSCIPVP